MKPKLLVTGMLIAGFGANAQVILTLQPDSALGRDAILHGLPSQVNTNYGNNDQFAAMAWTFIGTTGVVRSILEFDLTSIPPNAVVQSAYISLYAIDHASGFGYHSTLSGPNDGLLSRVTSPWNENSVTWNTHPSFTNLNQVALPASSSATQDYVNIDVTALVQDMVNDPLNSFGFLLMEQNETIYRRLNFCSSDHLIPAKRPKLVVTYQATSMNCITIKTTAGTGGGQDAFVHGLQGQENVNYGSNDQLAAVAWTFLGVPGVVRALLEFNLAGIPANAVIDSALLSLYAADATAGFGQHSPLSGPNDAWLQRVTSPWNEATVTWNTRPTTTTLNQYAIPASVSPTQDYLKMDVGTLVTDILNNPSSGYGFMIRLQTEQHYRRLNFCTGDHGDPARHPELKICFHTITGTGEITQQFKDIYIFPNPASDQLNINSKGFDISSVEIFNALGQRCFYTDNFPGKNDAFVSVDISTLHSGIYFIQMRNAAGTEVMRKFVKE